jgi:hypothetical protein
MNIGVARGGGFAISACVMAIKRTENALYYRIPASALREGLYLMRMSQLQALAGLYLRPNNIMMAAQLKL